MATLIVNQIRGVLKACAVKAPGFGDLRKAMLKDMAVLTGGQVVSEELGLKLETVVVEQSDEPADRCRKRQHDHHRRGGDLPDDRRSDPGRIRREIEDDERLRSREARGGDTPGHVPAPGRRLLANHRRSCSPAAPIEPDDIGRLGGKLGALLSHHDLVPSKSIRWARRKRQTCCSMHDAPNGQPMARPLRAGGPCGLAMKAAPRPAPKYDAETGRRILACWSVHRRPGSRAGPAS